MKRVRIDKNPEVIDQAATSKAKRESSGSGGFGPVIFLTSGIALGYGALKLYKDPEFCTTAREKAPALIQMIEPYIPMADKKDSSSSRILQ